MLKIQSRVKNHRVKAWKGPSIIVSVVLINRHFTVENQPCDVTFTGHFSTSNSWSDQFKLGLNSVFMQMNKANDSRLIVTVV